MNCVELIYLINEDNTNFNGMYNNKSSFYSDRNMLSDIRTKEAKIIPRPTFGGKKKKTLSKTKKTSGKSRSNSKLNKNTSRKNKPNYIQYGGELDNFEKIMLKIDKNNRVPTTIKIINVI
jgi:hypothetical protein